MSDDIQIQTGPVLQTKLAPDDDGQIQGWVCRYGERDLDDEVFSHGSFTDSLRETRASGVRLPLLWQHRMGEPIGSWHDLAESVEGIYGRARINTDTARGKEAWSLVQRGDVSGVSVGFRPLRRNGSTITQAQLMEASLVSIPAAPKARLKLKDCASVADLTAALAEGRLSRRDLEYVARKSWPGAADHPDPDELDDLAARLDRANAALRRL